MDYLNIKLLLTVNIITNYQSIQSIVHCTVYITLHCRKLSPDYIAKKTLSHFTGKLLLAISHSLAMKLLNITTVDISQNVFVKVNNIQ